MTREEALKKMQEVKAYMTAGNPIWSVTVIGEAFDMAIEALEAEERKRGRWIDETFKPNGLVFHPYKCDQCGEHNDAPSDYCPSCGADMRGEQG